MPYKLIFFKGKAQMSSDRRRKYGISIGKIERNPIFQIQLTELNNNQNKRCQKGQEQQL